MTPALHSAATIPDSRIFPGIPDEPNFGMSTGDHEHALMRALLARLTLDHEEGE